MGYLLQSEETIIWDAKNSILLPVNSIIWWLWNVSGWLIEENSLDR